MKQHFGSFYRIFLAEIKKLRRTFAFWLSILYPLGVTLMIGLFWISLRNSKSPDIQQFTKSFDDVASFFLPFYIVLIISVACYIEHKTSMFKHLLAQPVERGVYYLGKFAGILTYIIGSMIFMIIAAHVILLLSGLIDSRLGFTSSLITTLLIKQLFHACISAATVYTAQYWLSMRIKNLTLPVAMGAALIILPIAVLIIIGIAGLVSNPATFQNIITWNPYSYPFASAFQFVNSQPSGYIPLQTWIFLGISVIFLVWGTYDFAKRKIT